MMSNGMEMREYVPVTIDLPFLDGLEKGNSDEGAGANVKVRLAALGSADRLGGSRNRLGCGRSCVRAVPTLPTTAAQLWSWQAHQLWPNLTAFRQLPS
jgi:hypothetical protein